MLSRNVIEKPLKRSPQFINEQRRRRRHGGGAKPIPSQWQRESLNRYELTPGECVGCFNKADRHHATGWPCCLSCFGSDIIRLAKAKIRYCKKALAKDRLPEPEWLVR